MNTDLRKKKQKMILKIFTKNLFATEKRKTQILMNKPVYLGLSILDLSKTNV